MQEADACYEWKKSDVEKFLSKRAGFRYVIPELHDLPFGSDPIQAVAENIAGQVLPDELEGLITTTSEYQVPREIDVVLLMGASKALGRDLTHDEKKRVRISFVDALRIPPVES
jgi:hypothetical protein